MKNWKTTIAGILTIAGGIGMAVQGNYEQAIATIIAGVGLLLAKDYDTTGVGGTAEKL